MRTDPLAYLGDQLEDLKAQGLYRSLRILESEAKATSVYDGKSVVNLSSNNYLGLTTHPRLKQKAIEAIEQFGVGSGAVRSISGTMAMHMELERRLAEFKHTEAVVVFQSGFCVERRHRVVDPHARGRDHLRRTESRQHHRRRPPQPRHHQGLSAR